MEEFSRIKRLPPYVFNVTGELKMSARRRGEDIVDLSMGNPDQPTPRHIVDKLIEAVQRPDTHRYSVSKGIPRLRRAICNWYKTRYDVDLDFDHEAIVTIGSKEGLAHLALATLDTGDIVLVPNPSYPIHIYGPVIAGADIRHVPMLPGTDFFEEFDRAIRGSYPKPKMLIVNFPSNPTTQCVDLGFFEKLVKMAREHHVYVVHDLAYADIVFDGYKAPSIMQVPGALDIAVEFFTLSKSYSMAGWRVGFMVGNRDFLVGAEMLAACGVMALADPLVMSAFGERVLLTHGDALCLSDLDYQRFRAQVRSDEWQRDFLARPLAERRRIARDIRAQSREHKTMSERWIDVDATAAVQWMRQANTPVMIHGHTHMPRSETLAPGFVRHVLSDWDFDHSSTARADVLRWQRGGITRIAPASAA
ncbi:MAG TPA: UDP-2,3-diacylglucosamine diphosphatase [Albitalea sp.]|nr:UDP-2,3-diacylglucosamine diphosphatase [Albitalea sp.]